MSTLWTELYKDSPGGVYWRRLEPERFHLIVWFDWHEHENEPPLHYNVALVEVDLREAGDEAFKQVRSYVGEGVELERDNPWTADAFKSYGLAAPLLDNSGNNLHRLLAAAKRESKRLDDPEVLEEAMSRPVNRIGSTAREFMRGGINRGLLRTIQSGTVEGDILASAYGVKPDAVVELKQMPEITPTSPVTAQVNFSKVPHSDPIAFSTGYLDAIAGVPLPKVAAPEELAEGYLVGFRRGVDVRAGRAKPPEGIR